MKILAFAASSSRHSINRALVTHAAHRLTAAHLPDAEIELLDINDYEMPIFSIDREKEGGVPEEARAFFAKIGAADALLISYAEHNGFYTAAWKNIFDWMSRIETRVFQDTPTVALSTSPGKRGGANVLKTAVESTPRFGAEIVASLSVPVFREKFDADAGRLTDEALSAELESALAALAGRLQAQKTVAAAAQQS